MAHDLQALVQSGRRIRDRLSEDTRRVISGLESTLNSLQEDDIVEASEALGCISKFCTRLSMRSLPDRLHDQYWLPAGPTGCKRKCPAL